MVDAQLLHGDRIFRLAPNQGAHQLHGGPDAFDRRRWRILMRRPDRVLLGLESPDGDKGVPRQCRRDCVLPLG